MKKFFLSALVLYVATVSAANAQNIVTLSFNGAVIQTEEAQRDLKQLKARLAPRQAALKSLNDEVEALRKQIESVSDKLSDAERSTRGRSLDSKERQLQREAEDFKNDSQNESQQIFQRVAQKVYGFVQTYSQQHGYSAVIERGSDANPIVWYTATKVDITDDLIKAYNEQAGIRPAPSGSNQHSPARF